MHLETEAFEALVARALDGLPEWVRAHMDNVAIVVEDTPTREQRRVGSVASGGDLLGLYEGIPLTQRGRGYQLVPPDRITLFQRPLERLAAQHAESGFAPALIRLVRETIIHEVAHHFGFSERQLRELGC